MKKHSLWITGLLVAVFSLVSQGAWAGGGSHSTHYGKVTVTSAGNGSVYISTSNNATSGNTEESWSCGGNSNGDSKTFYLFAKPEPGYVFAGWSGSGISKNSPYQVSLSASSTNSGSPTAFNYTAKFVSEDDYVSLDSWMSKVDDNAFICQMSIPGAHDACSSSFSGTLASIYSGTSKTQNETVEVMLNSGLRLFDLRPCVSGSKLHINHGIATTSFDFDPIMKNIVDFVVAHPTEFCVVVIRHESEGDSNNSNFGRLLQESLAKIKTNLVDFRPDLTVGEARGKVLFISRDDYDAPLYGGRTYDLADNRTNINDMLGGKCYGPNAGGAAWWLQDHYEISDNAVKQQAIKDMLTRSSALAGKCEYTWVVNQTSGYRGTTSSASAYLNNAKSSNKYMCELLKSGNYNGPAGLVFMDYACTDDNNGYGQSLTEALIAHNLSFTMAKKGDNVYDGENLYVAPRGRNMAWTAKYVRKEGPQQPDGENNEAAAALDGIEPPAANWYAEDFNDASWSSMEFPIASFKTGVPYVNLWNGTYNTMYIRREFTIDNFSLLNVYKFSTWHDDDYKVYINGHQFDAQNGWTGMGLNDYREVEIPSQYLHAGKNILAIEVQQNWGGAYFDCGVLEIKGKPEEANLSEECILPSTEFDGGKSWKAATWVAISDEGFGEWSKENANFCKIMGSPADVDGKKWYASDYEVGSGWEVHEAPFADDNSSNYKWAPDGKFGDIYFRREFTTTGTMPSELYLTTGHDDAPCEYYINGELIWNEEGNQRDEGWYKGEVVKLTEAQKALIKTDGSVNVIAVHVHQNWGGYRADVGLYSGGTPKTNYDNSRNPLDELLASNHLNLFNNELNPTVQAAYQAQSIRDNNDAKDAIQGLDLTSLKARLQLYDTEWHSFVAPEYNVDFTGTGVEAYKAVEYVNGNDKYVHLEPVTTVTANQAVAVRSENGAGVLGIPVITSAADDFNDNIFKAKTEDFTVAESNTIYCIAKKDGVVGLYPVMQGVKVPAYKGYFELSAQSDAPLYIGLMMNDEETSISTPMQNLPESGIIYNVAGQRVQQLQKGLYIVNGKKIMVK